jgi:hypothetical protein
VAVDDTIHFLTWYRWGLDMGLSRAESIRESYRRVARAMFQTTAIGGLGMAVFALSTFTPTQRFGVLMLTLLSAALFGDLVFLPALLAGPLGKVFSPSSKDKKRRRGGESSSDEGGGDGGVSAETDGGAADGGSVHEPADATPPAVAGRGDFASPDPAGANGPHASGPQDLATKHLLRRQDAPHRSRQS